MKNLFFIVIMFLSIGAYSTNAQTVQVPQDVVDRCARCFDEAVELRKQVTALEVAGSKDKTTIESLKNLVSLYEKLSAADKEEIRELRLMVKELIVAIINKPTKKCVGIVLWC